MDAARSARRLGAESVTIVYRRRKDDMPALLEEVEAAEAGIIFRTMVNPTAVKGDGRVQAVTCVVMKAGEFDQSGRRRTSPVEGSEFDLPCDVFIPAIGQVTDPDGFAESGLEFARNVFKADPKTMATGQEGVYAGGDCVSGPATVIEAIEAGKRAARSIHAFLGGAGDVVPVSKHERKPRLLLTRKRQAECALRKFRYKPECGPSPKWRSGLTRRQRRASRKVSPLRCEDRGITMATVTLTIDGRR